LPVFSTSRVPRAPRTVGGDKAAGVVTTMPDRPDGIRKEVRDSWK
jgi:hypothetical protein